jgi:hypothetical protein
MIQIKKTILTLVALIAVTTGAWADETPLLTIENKDYVSFTSGSKTFDDKVTITFSKSVYNNGDANGWYAFGESLLTVAGINGYTITSCKFYTDQGTANTGYTVEGESPSVYLYDGLVYPDANQSAYIGYPGITKIEVYGTAPSASTATAVDIDWNKASKTGTFSMPGGNVELEPEYYPQAALTAAPTAINDVPATTDGAILKAGTVATIGSTTTAQGTVMYYVSTTALDDAALLALAADQWKADVPTAESLAQGQAYVYYYVRGNDSDTDDETFSDGDILAANALTVTIAAAPTYAVTFAEGTDANEWTASPAADVKKGQTVTVTYTGTRKVIGVKAEKKAAAVATGHALAESAVGELVGSDGLAYAAADKDNLPDGVTAVAMIAYVGSETGVDGYTHGLALALSDDYGYQTWTDITSHSPAVTGGIWLLASEAQWNKMINAMGSDGLRDGFSSVGGTNLENYYYWSSTAGELGHRRYAFDVKAWYDSNPNLGKAYGRACLAF